MLSNCYMFAIISILFIAMLPNVTNAIKTTDIAIEDMSSNLECIAMNTDGCFYSINADNADFCCDYFRDTHAITAEDSVTYLRTIRDIGITYIVLEVILLIALGVFAYSVYHQNDAQEYRIWTCIQPFVVLISFALSLAMVGIINNTHIIELFEDLDTFNCYTTEMDYPMSWFKLHTNAILITAAITGSISFIHACIACATLLFNGESKYTFLEGTCCLSVLTVIQIVLWSYIFPTYNQWHNVQVINAETVQCYIIGTSSPTLEPTYHPSFIPTIDPTLDPSSNPTLNPTLQPTFDPTYTPTLYPTEPTGMPTTDPTWIPTINPTEIPTIEPTVTTFAPTVNPTPTPVMQPTVIPTIQPTFSPTIHPTHVPSTDPTVNPTMNATKPISGATVNTETNDVGNFYRIDASENTPFTLIALGTLISFLINLYMFYGKISDNDDQSCLEKCCGTCIMECFKKCEDEIKWLIGGIQVLLLVFPFVYSWQLGSDAGPDDGRVTWDNYQCFAKAFAISSHFKNTITTTFVILVKEYIIKGDNQAGGKDEYHRSTYIYRVVWALSCAFYCVSFLCTHLIAGIFVFFPIVIIGAVGFVVFYFILARVTGFEFGWSKKSIQDWNVWVWGILCAFTVVFCIIIMQCMVIFLDDPSLWKDAIAIVFTERNWAVFWQSKVDDAMKWINFVTMIL